MTARTRTQEIQRVFTDGIHRSTTSNSFSTPPLSRVTTLDNASSGPPKRMASTALPPTAPYAAVPKPWTQKPNPRATFSYYLTWFLLFVGASLGGVQSYFSYHNFRIDRAPLCLVFLEDFNAGDDAAVFGSGGSPGRWLRDVQMDGFGNGEFEMTMSSSNDGDFNAGPTGTDFDWSGYFASTRVSALINLALDGDEKTLTCGSIRYSTVEVSAKMPTGGWLWSLIWMLPVPGADGASPLHPLLSSPLVLNKKTDLGLRRRPRRIRSGEIDLVESRGNGIRYTNRYVPLFFLSWGRSQARSLVLVLANARTAQRLQPRPGALHWGLSPQLNGVSKSYSWWTDRRTPFSNDFHTYTIEWTDKWLRISVDTRLHTLLGMQFNESFWERGGFSEDALPFGLLLAASLSPSPPLLPFPFLSSRPLCPVPSSLIISPDGRLETLQDPLANATNKNAAPFDQDFCLIMNVAVGGTNGWFPDGQGNKPWLNHAGNPMANFASNKGQWLPTWPENVEDRAMVMDYIKMWKHCGDA
ncbi:Glucan 1,3-beta-glucosidase [Mycena venus]|uniref:Glucan 1,3-beta-glucosidase n=1 Tax=Mycena venus TaxID=2733690 RepID=A0A8H6X784_9AGAR|nr:Glucan 1,3-beta-glucosidase [Mycena venus]